MNFWDNLGNDIQTFFVEYTTNKLALTIITVLISFFGLRFLGKYVDHRLAIRRNKLADKYKRRKDKKAQKKSKTNFGYAYDKDGNQVIYYDKTNESKRAKIAFTRKLLDRILYDRVIIIWGGAGAGKSLLMNLMGYRLYIKLCKYIKKNKRELRYMSPDYINKLIDMLNKGKMPIYSNIFFRDKKRRLLKALKKVRTARKRLQPAFARMKAKSKNGNTQKFLSSKGSALVWEQKLKAIYKGFILQDEIGKKFRVQMHTENDDEHQDASDLVRLIRHYFDGHIIGTEQDAKNIYINVRRYSHCDIKALRTNFKISLFGRILRRVLLTGNLAWYFAPVKYYTRKRRIKGFIFKKFSRIKTYIMYNGQKYRLNYKFKMLFDYDTRAFKDEYDAKFKKETKTA